MPGMFDYFRGPNPSRGMGRGRGYGLGLGNTDPGEARALALLNAMGPMQEAGLQRSAGPMGSIAKNLIPLFGAIIQGKLLEQQATMDQQLLQAKIAEVGGDPEMRAAKLKQLGALTAQEQSLADERKGMGSYREKLMKRIDELSSGGGQPGQQGGMRESYSMSPSGPTISGKSDVMSPEAFQQQKDIQASSSTQALVREKDMAEYKQALAKNLSDYKNANPKMGEKEVQTVTSAKTLVGLMDTAKEALDALKDVDRADYATQARNYQLRAERPMFTNTITGLSGGFWNADTDPKLDPVFSLTGQVKAALASFNLGAMGGRGIQMLNFLSDHFPGYGDSPDEASRKLGNLLKDKSIVKQRLQDIIDFYEKRGTMLEAPGAVDHPVNKNPGQASTAWMGWTYVTKSGEQRRVWRNPETTEMKDLPLNEVPPIEDPGIR